MTARSGEPNWDGASQADPFSTTNWSVVLQAGDHPSPKAVQALEQLCIQYYSPIYAYVRRRGYQPEETEDLTQDFFARLIKNNLLRSVVRERGKFRAFLQVTLKNFLGDQRDRANTQKRGGGQKHISFPAAEAEARYHWELVDGMTPEKLFEMDWATTLLQNVLNRLEEEYRSDGQERRFALLYQYLAGKGDSPYAEAARDLNLTEDAVKVAVHRLRKRYRAILEEELLRTVAGPEELRDEVSHLLAIFSEKGLQF